MKILVMESSTTSAKAMLCDTAAGGLQVVEKPYAGQKTGEGTQDADAVLSKTLRLAGGLCRGRQIDMIALVGTFHSVLLCDKRKRPETPSFLWSYMGAGGLCADLRRDQGYVRRYYEKTGCMVHAVYPFFKLMHFKREGRDLTGRYIFGQGSYNFYKMTGSRTEMDSMASGTGMFGIAGLAFDSDLLGELGVREEQLPKITDWETAAPLGREAANILGIREGTPVMNAGPDGALNQIGSGALADGIMTLSVGTSAALRLSTDGPELSADGSTWCYRSPKKWLSGAATSGGSNCVDWIRGLLFPPGTSYEECERGIRPDMRGAPVFLPFLYGERCPGWNDGRRASFSGVLPGHTPHDYYYSVLEGVLFNIYQCYGKLCGLNGMPSEIKVSGGILHSPRWLQMCADILNRELLVDEVKNGSMAGGLALALEILKADFNPAGSEQAGRILPDQKKHERYMERYEAYLKEYEA